MVVRMTVVCPECGSVNKKGNKFCFECGMKLPFDKLAQGLASGSKNGRPEQTPTQPAISSSDAKRRQLKSKWLKGQITAEEYRGHLLRLRLKERFGSHMVPPEGSGNGNGTIEEEK